MEGKRLHFFGQTDVDVLLKELQIIGYNLDVHGYKSIQQRRALIKSAGTKLAGKEMFFEMHVSLVQCFDIAFAAIRHGFQV